MPQLLAFKADAVLCPLHQRKILVRGCSECRHGCGTIYRNNQTFSHCLFIRESPAEDPTIPDFGYNAAESESELITYGSS